MEISLDEDDEVTDIREQMFHNTVREQIVSSFFDHSTIIVIIIICIPLHYVAKKKEHNEIPTDNSVSCLFGRNDTTWCFCFIQNVCMCLWH